MSQTSRIAAVPANPPNPAREAIETNIATFQINNATIYVAVVILSINNMIKILGNIKQWLKRTISWNKYRSQITTQLQNKNLVYLIDSTFGNK